MAANVHVKVFFVSYESALAIEAVPTYIKLHHVVGRHEWAFGDGGGPARCEHEPLPYSWKSKTITEGSPAHIALRES